MRSLRFFSRSFLVGLFYVTDILLSNLYGNGWQPDMGPLILCRMSGRMHVDAAVKNNCVSLSIAGLKQPLASDRGYCLGSHADYDTQIPACLHQ